MAITASQSPYFSSTPTLRRCAFGWIAILPLSPMRLVRQEHVRCYLADSWVTHVTGLAAVIYRGASDLDPASTICRDSASFSRDSQLGGIDA
jgi:hypothetical protein